MAFRSSKEARSARARLQALHRAVHESEGLIHSVDRGFQKVLSQPERFFANVEDERVDRILARTLASLHISQSLLESQLHELGELSDEMDRILKAKS